MSYKCHVLLAILAILMSTNTELLKAFNDRFEQIIAEMNAIAIDDVLSIDRTDLTAFFRLSS